MRGLVHGGAGVDEELDGVRPVASSGEQVQGSLSAVVDAGCGVGLVFEQQPDGVGGVFVGVADHEQGGMLVQLQVLS